MFECLVYCCLGSLVRELKSQGGDKSQIDVEVKRLLELKGQYKQLTGHDWTPLGGGGGGAKKEKGKGQNPPVVPKGETLLSGLLIVHDHKSIPYIVMLLCVCDPGPWGYSESVDVFALFYGVLCLVVYILLSYVGIHWCGYVFNRRLYYFILFTSPNYTQGQGARD